MSYPRRFLHIFLFTLLAATAIRAAGIRDELLRTYTYLDLAECLEDFRDRQYFEFIYRYAHIDRTPQYKFMLGHLYHHGLGTERDPVQARRWYREASSGGYQFQPYLGNEAEAGLRALGEAGLATEDGPQEMTMLEMEFAGKSAAEKLRLATQYFYGLCVPMDYEKGLEWETAAAAEGDRNAIISVSDNYRYGQFGYPLNTAQADMWRERLRTADLKPQSVLPPPPKPMLPGETRSASELLGTVFSETMKGAGIALEDVKPARDNSKTQSLGEYAADIFEDGMRHYRAGDYYRAGLEFVEAAAFGLDDPECHYLLGRIQEEGMCGEANFYGAGKSYRIAADMGHTDAMLRLARLHENGSGVRRSLLQAGRWYAQAGNAPEAREGLRRVEALLAEGNGDDELPEELRHVLADAQFRASFNYTPFRLHDEMKKAIGYLLKAADNSHPYAQFLAAQLYKTGAPDYGVAADSGRAASLLDEAARGGVRDAAAMKAGR